LPAALDLGQYYALNDAIFEHFFRPEYAGRSVTLALDDAEAAVIEDDMGLEHGQLAEQLFTALRTLARPISGSRDRFLWWAERHARECVALLAASVLVMSRQGIMEDGGVDQSGYYSRYSQQVLQLESNAAPSGFDFQKILWRRLESYLNSELDGALGRIVFLRVLEYAHLNFSASQCLIRALDKRRLRDLFRRHCNSRTELSRKHFSQIIAVNDGGLSRGFLRVARQVATQSDLAEEFWNIIVDEYSAWQRNPDETIARETSSAAVHRVIVRDDYAIQKSGRTPAPSMGNTEIATTVPAPKVVRRVESESRLVLTGYPGSPVQLFVEGLIHSSGAPEQADWKTVGAYLTGDNFRDGFRRESDRCIFRFGPHEQAYFESQGPMWIQLSTPPAEPKDLCVLCVDEISPEFREALERHGKDVRSLTLARALCGLSGFAFTFVPNTRAPEADEESRAVLVDEVVSIELASGLRLRDGRFMENGPPFIVVRDPKVSEAQLLLDGTPVGSVAIGEPFRLPADRCGPGRHVVEALSKRRVFAIASADEVVPFDDASSLGYVISRHPAMMRTDPKAEDLRIEELAVKNAAVLVGGDLLLPYRRAGS
jgi:hypothetical protein